jgi:hypothetical protein
MRGTDDRGDIAGIPGVVIECKNTARLELAQAVDEAELEGRNANARVAVAVIKRRGKSAAGAYVVMSLATFAELTAEQDPAVPVVSQE